MKRIICLLFLLGHPSFVLAGTRALLVILIMLTIPGCGRSTREQNIWVHFGDGPTPEYANFYEEFPKYPDYAIVEYPINQHYNTNLDITYLRKSIRDCRAAFGKAYKTKTLQRFNANPGSGENLRETADYKSPFNPRYIVFAIKNDAEHTGSSTFAASYKVAYIIPINMVLADPYSFKKAVQAAYVDRSPFYFEAPYEEEPKGWSPNERYRWLAIERHESKMKNEKAETHNASK